MEKISMEKLLCEECGWNGYSNYILRAKNPFLEDETIYACPKCIEINSLIVACEHEGCFEKASCGTNTENGYLRTCGKHVPNIGINYE